MIMGIAKRRRAARLGPGRGKAAGAISMTLLGDEGSAPAITVLLVEDDAPTCVAAAGCADRGRIPGAAAAATLAEARAGLAGARQECC